MTAEINNLINLVLDTENDIRNGRAIQFSFFYFNIIYT
jgi:hypothetical protein